VGDAKNIIVKPISSRDANKIIKALHYSGKVVNNSQLHWQGSTDPDAPIMVK
jgi:hypothetical protein